MSRPPRAYLVRHAAAEPHGAAPDPERRLTPEGREAFAALAASLTARLDLKAIVTSPFIRTRETADLLAEAVPAPVEEEPSLASDASSGAEVLALLAQRGGGVALVGHDPEFSEALTLAAGRKTEMAKGAVAAIDLTTRGPTLAWVEAPKKEKHGR